MRGDAETRRCERGPPSSRSPPLFHAVARAQMPLAMHIWAFRSNAGIALRFATSHSLM